MASQENFEVFLIEEFKEQHANMRQTEGSAMQFIQQALTGEGLIIAGLFTLLSVKIPLQTFLVIASLAFLSLSLFLHIVFVVAINATIAVWKINSQNAFTRIYFGDNSKNRSYLYFYPPKTFFYLKPKKWEIIQGTMPSLSRFIGYINSMNITLFLFLSGATLFSTTIHLQMDYLLSSGLFLLILLLVVIVALIVASVYLRSVYTARLRIEERKTGEERSLAYQRLLESHPHLSDADFLHTLLASNSSSPLADESANSPTSRSQPVA
jgi:hypothetical protein